MTGLSNLLKTAYDFILSMLNSHSSDFTGNIVLVQVLPVAYFIVGALVLGFVFKGISALISVFCKFIKGHTIEIKDEFTDSLPYEMAVTIEDVEEYIQKVANANPRCLQGIDSITLSNHSNKIDNLLGTFKPTSKRGSGVIRIYPLRYDAKRKKFVMPLSSGAVYVAFTKKEAKELQLFTLGHEIGHCVIFRKGGGLKGKEIEKRCDEFSERLNIVRNPKDLGEFIANP